MRERKFKRSTHSQKQIFRNVSAASLKCEMSKSKVKKVKCIHRCRYLCNRAHHGASLAHREVKIRSGEWFLEQRARKFPLATGLLTRFRQQVFTVDLFLISLSRLIIKTPLISSGSATSSHKIWMIRAVFFFVFFKP